MSEIIEGTICARCIAMQPQLVSTIDQGSRLRREVERNLTHCLWKSNGKLTTWIVVTKQHIGDSCSSLRTRIPCLNNGRNELISPVNRQRSAIDQHQYHRLSCSLNSL